MTMGMPLFDQAEGELRKEAGIRRVSGHHPAWISKAVDALRRIAAAQVEFTSDHLQAVLQERPPTPNAVGAAFSAASKMGICEKTGTWRPSTRPEAHGRAVAVWRRCGIYPHRYAAQ